MSNQQSGIEQIAEALGISTCLTNVERHYQVVSIDADDTRVVVTYAPEDD